MKFYKIRDMVTGLYSSGGNLPHFTKKGKMWKRLCDVKSHLTLQDKNIPVTWVIVEYDVIEGDEFPAGSIVKQKQ